jgi:hypothetical protein
VFYSLSYSWINGKSDCEENAGREILYFFFSDVEIVYNFFSLNSFYKLLVLSSYIFVLYSEVSWRISDFSVWFYLLNPIILYW